MSDKTLSQRLRELETRLEFIGMNADGPSMSMLAECIAQAEAQEAKAIGEQTPVVIKDSEVFTACETYADNYLIEGRITTSPKAMRMALKKFMEGRSPMSSDARDLAIEALAKDVIYAGDHMERVMNESPTGLKEIEASAIWSRVSKNLFSALRG